MNLSIILICFAEKSQFMALVVMIIVNVDQSGN